MVYDKKFYGMLTAIALPVAFQSLLSLSVVMLDNIMVGSLGETALASVALANQITVLFTFFIRGMSGDAFTFLDNKRLKAFASEVVEEKQSALDFVCGDNKILRLTEIQLEGKSRMNSADFLRGYK